MPIPDPPKEQIRQFDARQDDFDELRAVIDAARNANRRRLSDRRHHPRGTPDRRGREPLTRS
jgi:hypothetical protein